MITLRTYADKVLVEESAHRRTDTAVKAMEKRGGDTAVILTPEAHYWFERRGSTWSQKYVMIR